MSHELASFLALRPAGGFDLIMADPPWSYEMRSEKGYGRAPDAHYTTMPLDDIKRLPVEVLAAPNCLLWLWSVGPMLPQALEVIAAWGFTFKTAGSWAKVGQWQAGVRNGLSPAQRRRTFSDCHPGQPEDHPQGAIRDHCAGARAQPQARCRIPGGRNADARCPPAGTVQPPDATRLVGMGQ